jgi:hypothetical protein
MALIRAMFVGFIVSAWSIAQREPGPGLLAPLARRR